MNRNAIAALLTLFVFPIHGQNINRNSIGINILQLPTSTINLNYSRDYKPFLTLAIDMGYTFDYEKTSEYDVVGYYLTRHEDTYDGYTLTKRSGYYVKSGAYFNLRRDYTQTNFFHAGLFLTQSFIYEKCNYLPPWDSRPYSEAREMDHTINMTGLSMLAGYEFRLAHHIKTSFDFQFTYISEASNSLYSYNNFIPGMGLTGNSSSLLIPMMIWNIKYQF